ncbi:hypothetical protein niasHT_001428 [Heterodera trifolii]|uniref:Uncharacterized protein n=1 Tax=Heterodera trifolii TaxID=157864 RepID=A0ABD2LSG1_9BILA
MPRSRSSSSSSDSIKPDTALLSHWHNSAMCTDLSTNYICTHASIMAHQMIRVQSHKKFRHHAVRVTVKCFVCQTSAPRTYDFSGFGAYEKHRAIIADQPISLGFASMEDIFRKMEGMGTYSLCQFNCQDWSKKFMDEVLKNTMIGTHQCPCQNEFKNAKIVQVMRKERRHVFARSPLIAFAMLL